MLTRCRLEKQRIASAYCLLQKRDDPFIPKLITGIYRYIQQQGIVEFAVWRASCLQFDTRFQSMEDVLEHESSQAPGEFDTHFYKEDRRIKSGADIIVRDVSHFWKASQWMKWPIQELSLI